VQKERAPCVKYVVNMGSASFGECVCGRPKADHTPEALAATDKASKGNAVVDARILRAQFVQNQLVDCAAYQIDMKTPGVPFGQCVCGQPKAKHSEAALAGSLARSKSMRKSGSLKE